MATISETSLVAGIRAYAAYLPSFTPFILWLCHAVVGRSPVTDVGHSSVPLISCVCAFVCVCVCLCVCVYIYVHFCVFQKEVTKSANVCVCVRVSFRAVYT